MASKYRISPEGFSRRTEALNGGARIPTDWAIELDQAAVNVLNELNTQSELHARLSIPATWEDIPRARKHATISTSLSRQALELLTRLLERGVRLNQIDDSIPPSHPQRSTGWE